MAKSKILKELANNEVDLEVALSRLMVIANDFEDSSLQQWAINELQGYAPNEKIPEYRQLKGELRYSGLNNEIYKVNDMKLDLSYIGEEALKNESLLKVNFRQGISIFLSSSKSKEEIKVDRTDLSPIVYRHSNETIEAYRIYLSFHPSQMQNIINNIRTKLLQIFLELDKFYGNLDSLDISKQVENQINVESITKTIIYQDNSINNGEINIAKENSVLEVNQNNGINVDQLNDLLTQVKKEANSILSAEDRNAILKSLTAIEEQSKLETPKRSKLKQAFLVLKGVKGTAEFAAAVASLSQLFSL